VECKAGSFIAHSPSWDVLYWREAENGIRQAVRSGADGQGNSGNVAGRLLAGWPQTCLGEGVPPFLDMGGRGPDSRPITRCILLFESATKLQIETLLGKSTGCQSSKWGYFNLCKRDRFFWGEMTMLVVAITFHNELHIILHVD
jgi:hypothetical protein